MENVLYVPASIADQLPSTVKTQLAKMTAEQQSQFVEEFKRKAKSKSTGIALAILLGWHYAYLNRWGLQFLLWISCALAVGFIWWFVDLFRVSGMITDWNKDVATEILRDMKIIQS